MKLFATETYFKNILGLSAAQLHFFVDPLFSDFPKQNFNFNSAKIFQLWATSSRL